MNKALLQFKFEWQHSLHVTSYLHLIIFLHQYFCFRRWVLWMRPGQAKQQFKQQQDSNHQTTGLSTTQKNWSAIYNYLYLKRRSLQTLSNDKLTHHTILNIPSSCLEWEPCWMLSLSFPCFASLCPLSSHLRSLELQTAWSQSFPHLHMEHHGSLKGVIVSSWGYHSMIGCPWNYWNFKRHQSHQTSAHSSTRYFLHSDDPKHHEHHSEIWGTKAACTPEANPKTKAKAEAKTYYLWTAASSICLSWRSAPCWL